MASRRIPALPGRVFHAVVEARGSALTSPAMSGRGRSSPVACGGALPPPAPQVAGSGPGVNRDEPSRVSPGRPGRAPLNTSLRAIRSGAQPRPAPSGKPVTRPSGCSVAHSVLGAERSYGTEFRSFLSSGSQRRSPEARTPPGSPAVTAAPRRVSSVTSEFWLCPPRDRPAQPRARRRIPASGTRRQETQTIPARSGFGVNPKPARVPYRAAIPTTGEKVTRADGHNRAGARDLAIYQTDTVSTQATVNIDEGVQ
jgi:hypothetical protein